MSKKSLQPDNRGVGGRRVTMRDVSALRAYTGNARTHSEAQVAQIAASIREFGFTNPVLATRDGMILAGHGRYAAAQQLGLATIPTITVGAEWTEEQVRAYVLADNQIALNAGWDEDLLAIEVGYLDAAGFDVSLLGFDEDDLRALLTGPVPGDGAGDGADEADNLVAPGDVWQLGRHRLICGDSSKAEVLNSVLGSAVPDLAIYDPPYEVAAAWRHMRDEPAAIIFHDYKYGARAFAAAARFAVTYQFIWDGGASWYTPNRPLARHKAAIVALASPHWDFDAAIYHDGKKREAKQVRNTRGAADYRPLPNGMVHLSTVFQQANTSVDGEHAHSKPVEWVRALLAGSRAKVALDYFAGGGTAFVAAPDAMTIYGVEIDPASCAGAIARFQAATGIGAERISGKDR